jgi:hypothetical protein
MTKNDIERGFMYICSESGGTTREDLQRWARRIRRLLVGMRPGKLGSIWFGYIVLRGEIKIGPSGDPRRTIALAERFAACWIGYF